MQTGRELHDKEQRLLIISFLSKHVFLTFPSVVILFSGTLWKADTCFYNVQLSFLLYQASKCQIKKKFKGVGYLINSLNLWQLTWPARGVMSLRPLWSPDADHVTTTRPKNPCCLTTFSWTTLSLWSSSCTVSSLES